MRYILAAVTGVSDEAWRHAQEKLEEQGMRKLYAASLTMVGSILVRFVIRQVKRKLDERDN